MESPNYYAIIPARVRYSNKLKPSAKLLYGEIVALSNKHGFCYATNNYFSTLYNVSKNTVSAWIKDLRDNNFIKVEIERNEKKQIVARKIYIPIEINVDRGISENVKDNIKDKNIKIDNNIHTRRLKFEEIVFQVTDISKDVKQEFCDYWTEYNTRKNKMRFEYQKTFDINLRLKRWQKFNEKWRKPNKESNVKNVLNEHQKALNLLKKFGNV